MIALNIPEMRGNALVCMNLTAHSADPRFVAPETDRRWDSIVRPRAVAAACRTLRPPVEQTGAVMAVTMARRRRVRDGALALAGQEQENANRRRSGGPGRCPA